MLFLAGAAAVAVGAHDVRMDLVALPLDTTRGRWPTYPWAWIENCGTFTERNTPVRCWIDSAGVRLYDGGSVHEPPLPPMGMAMVSGFPKWRFTPGSYLCDVTMFTELETDEDRSNDTMYTTTYVQLAPVADRIWFERISWVAVDGYVDQYEWDFWRSVDISDVNGQGGMPWPLGTIAFYSAHNDSNFAYVALDILPIHWQSPMVLDSVIVMLDEDRDSLWAPDSSEGCYVLYADGMFDSLAFYSMPGRVPMPCPRGRVASSVESGNLQVEAAVPIGPEKASIDVTPWYDASGLAVSFWRRGTCYGWWPQSLDKEHWDDPACYGQVWWLSMGAADSRMQRSEQPSPSATLPGRSLVLPKTLGHSILVSISGRKVMDLKPGMNDIRHIAPGVYFVRRPETEDGRPYTALQKVIIQR